MAARENQGLQIALIVFVMLTIMLSVATFLFFRNYQSEQQRAKSAEDKEGKATQSLAKAQSELEAYLAYIGYQPDENKDTVEENFKKDMAIAATLGFAELPEDEQNYRKLVENYENLTRTLHAQLAKKDEDYRAAKATLDRKTAEYEQEKQTLADEKTETVNKYIAERDRIRKQLEELTATKTQLTNEKAEKDKALDELRAKTDSEINKLKEELVNSQGSIARLKDQNNELSGEFNVNAAPDGKIVWVNQRAGTAFINLGTADRLRKRITFSVFDPGTTDVSALKPEASKVGTPASAAISKGSIEVVNITERHMAECRILQHSPSNPILPGDYIYTPVWQPGQQDRFAFVGLIDIDGDGADDRRRVRDLIQLNGGLVTDEIDVNTRYLVVGKVEETSQELEANNKKLDDAKRFDIQHVQLSQFLEMMGYSPKVAEEAIAPGDGPQPPHAGEPVGTFRPRTPPTRSRNGGAY